MKWIDYVKLILSTLARDFDSVQIVLKKFSSNPEFKMFLTLSARMNNCFKWMIMWVREPLLSSFFALSERFKQFFSLKIYRMLMNSFSKIIEMIKRNSLELWVEKKSTKTSEQGSWSYFQIKEYSGKFAILPSVIIWR